MDIGGLSIGGQPGKNPTALFGTAFYGKGFQSIDDESIKRAILLIKEQQKLSEQTGLSAIPDIYIKDACMALKIIGATLESTKGPFAIDSSDSKARVRALEAADELGALSRTIYNSINLGITEDEISALKEHTPAAAIVLAYNPRDCSVDGRADMLKSGAGLINSYEGGLLDLARDAGIKGLLVDTGATPFGNMSSEAIRALPVFKNLFGMPVGCSIHNTLESWNWMKDIRPENEQAYQCANACANGLIPLYGGDFIVYGPISEAKLVFPSVAFVDKLIAEGAKDYFNSQISGGHPYEKLK